MKKLSYWGRLNPIHARFIIFLATAFGMMLSLALGVFIYFEWGTDLISAKYVFCAVFLLAVILYPLKKKKSSYAYRKTMDGLLIYSSFALALTLPSGIVYENFSSWSSITEIQEIDASIAPLVITKDPELSKKKVLKRAKKMFKSIKKFLKDKKRQYKKEGNKKGRKFTKFLLVLLTVTGIIVLGYLVVALACNLSCGGNEGAAILIVVGGAVLIVYLMFLAFRGISRME